MTDYTKISTHDVDNLEYAGRSSNAVGAIGAGALVYKGCADRLLKAALVQKLDPSITGNAALVITDRGRAFLSAHR